jgi:hypothetical protein
MDATPPTHDPDDLRVATTKQDRPLTLAERLALHRQRTTLLEQLGAVDRSLAALAKERRRLLDHLAGTAQALWSPADWSRGRRPGTDTVEDPLPPLPEAPRWLFGRRLRSVCLLLLRRCGALPLRQLHALLHLHGFGVAGGNPVKVLADALGHEADAGNAVREARGRYRASPEYVPRRSRRLFVEALDLPEVDE